MGAELTTRGLSLSMGGFRSLLDAERKQSAEKGENVRCECRSSVLPALADARIREALSRWLALVPRKRLTLDWAAEIDMDQILVKI